MNFFKVNTGILTAAAILVLVFIASVNPVSASTQFSKVCPATRFMQSLSPNQVTDFINTNDYFALKNINGVLYAGGFLQISNKAFNADKYNIKVISSVNYDNSEILSVWIPFYKITETAQDASVIRFEAAVKNTLAFQNNLQAPIGDPVVGCDITKVQAQFPGKGVIAGIIDSGIDCKHKDFSDSAFMGVSSRILSIWDQTDINDFYHEANSLFWSYGKKQSASGIIDSLKNNIALSAEDDIGHGTHIAGIIAGNGSGAGSGINSDDASGIAPYSSIISVKTQRYSNTIIDAMDYIKNISAESNLPFVINLSMGNHYGAHDGTSLFEKSASAIAGNKGIIIASAGNDRDKKIHTTATFQQNQKQIFNLTKIAGKNNLYTDSSNTFFCISFWINSADSFEAGIVINGQSLAFSASPDTQLIYPAGNAIYYINNCFDDNLHPLGDKQIFFACYIPDGIPGSLSIELTKLKNASADEIHGWICSPPDGSLFFSSNPDIRSTITIPATSPAFIAVGAYISGDFWQAENGRFYEYDIMNSKGALAPFSSLGPSRKSLNLIFPGADNIKPELTAPGTGVISALSSNAKSNIEKQRIFQDGNHCISQGSSIAAPHVAGAAVLLRQKYPAMTNKEIRRLIIENAFIDSLTGSSPNMEWGYGKLNISAPLYDPSQIPEWKNY